MIATIDCRSLEDYKQGHLKHSAHICIESLEQSWHQFPVKGTKLNLCCYQEDSKRLSELFQQQNYPLERIISHQQLKQADNVLEQGTDSLRLWKGNPLLEQHSELILANTSAPNPIALDIGCGSGRDSILMAQHGFEVVAIDNKGYALENLARFASQTSARVYGKMLDCQKNPQQLVELIIDKQPQLIMQSRYLHRPLLDLYQQHLPSGAIVAIHTFLEGAASFGSPKNPAYLLNNNELAEKFSTWNILLDEVHLIEDGRPLSLFLAKKP